MERAAMVCESVTSPRNIATRTRYPGKAGNIAQIRTLRDNFFWNAIGSGLFAVSQWAVLIVFAKLGTPTLVGELAYGTAVTAPLFVVAGLQLRSIQATDCTDRYTVGQYLGLRLWTTVVAFLITFAIAAVMWRPAPHIALILVLWGLCKVVDSGSDALYGIFQQAERMDYAGLSLGSRGIMAVLLSVITFKITHSAPITLLSMFAGWSIVFLTFDYPVARALVRYRASLAALTAAAANTLKLVLKPVHLKALCIEAAPLGFVAFLLAIQVQIPRYVVAGRLETHQLGLFSAASYLTFVGSIIVNALGAPACVRLARHFADGEPTAFARLLRKMLLASTLLGAVGTVIAAVCGRWILTLLYTPEYARMYGVLTMLCAASAVSLLASCFGYAMTALQKFKVQVPIFIGVVVITLVSCSLLTMVWGLMGTATGMLIGSLSQLLMSASIVLRTLSKDVRSAGSEVQSLIAAGDIL